MRKDQPVGRIRITGGFQRPTMVVRAPADGTVVVDSRLEGNLVTAGTGLAVAYLSAVRVTARVDETAVRDVRVGQPVDISVDAYPGVTLAGTVREVRATAARQPSAEETGRNCRPATQVVPVDIAIADRGDRTLVPGMDVTVRIHRAGEQRRRPVRCRCRSRVEGEQVVDVGGRTLRKQARRPPRRPGPARGRGPLGHPLLRARPDDRDRAIGRQDAPERDGAEHDARDRPVPAVPDDQQVRRTGLLDQDLCRAPRKRPHLDGDQHEPGPRGAHRIDLGPRPPAEVRLDVGGHLPGRHPHSPAQYSTGTKTEIARTRPPRRAASSTAYCSAARDSAVPSTPTTTVARSSMSTPSRPGLRHRVRRLPHVDIRGGSAPARRANDSSRRAERRCAALGVPQPLRDLGGRPPRQASGLSSAASGPAVRPAGRRVPGGRPARPRRRSPAAPRGRRRAGTAAGRSGANLALNASSDAEPVHRLQRPADTSSSRCRASVGWRRGRAGPAVRRTG